MYLFEGEKLILPFEIMDHRLVPQSKPVLTATYWDELQDNVRDSQTLGGLRRAVTELGLMYVSAYVRKGLSGGGKDKHFRIGSTPNVSLRFRCEAGDVALSYVGFHTEDFGIGYPTDNNFLAQYLYGPYVTEPTAPLTDKGYKLKTASADDLNRLLRVAGAYSSTPIS